LAVDAGPGPLKKRPLTSARPIVQPLAGTGKSSAVSESMLSSAGSKFCELVARLLMLSYWS
jgi:hypothetical protein